MNKIMTRIREIINTNVDMHQDNVERLVTYAYYMGREDKALETEKRLKEVLKAQEELDKNCMYCKMAMDKRSIINYVYDPDYYDDWVASFTGIHKNTDTLWTSVLSDEELDNTAGGL